MWTLSRRAVADRFGMPFFRSVEGLIEPAQPSGVIITTTSNPMRAAARLYSGYEPQVGEAADCPLRHRNQRVPDDRLPFLQPLPHRRRALRRRKTARHPKGRRTGSLLPLRLT